MGVERRAVVAGGVGILAGLLGLGAFAARTGQLTDDPDTSGEQADPAPATDRGPDVRLGHLSFVNVYEKPISVGITVERDGRVIHESTYDLPAGEKQGEGAYSGTSLGIDGWDRPGAYVVTAELPDARRTVDVAEQYTGDCATVAFVVQGPGSVWTMVEECADDA